MPDPISGRKRFPAMKSKILALGQHGPATAAPAPEQCPPYLAQVLVLVPMLHLQ